MKIGELAKTTGTQVETVRFYEREGLLPEAARTDGNYRVYSLAHVARLRFIRQCRNLDMTLDEVRALLHFKDAPRDDCGEVNALLDEHIGHVAHRIRELRRLERELRDLRAQCTAPTAAGCGILSGIEKAVGHSEGSHTRRHVRGAH